MTDHRGIRFWLLIPLICLAAAGLVACTSQEDAEPSETVGLSQTVGPTNTVRPELASLIVSLDVPSEVQQGEAVALTLKVRNPSDKAIVLGLDGRPAHDFVVKEPNGEEVWTSGGFILSILDRLSLGPGEEVRYEGEWDQTNNEGEPVPAGTYEVHGVLRLEGPVRLEAEPVPIVISP